MKNKDLNDHIEHYNNLDLIYAYTESILKAVNDDTNTINTKLGTVIAFNSVLIRIAMDLPDQMLTIGQLPCYMCLLIKVIIFALLICSVWISSSGLLFLASTQPTKLTAFYYGRGDRTKLWKIAIKFSPMKNTSKSNSIIFDKKANSIRTYANSISIIFSF